MNKIIKAYQKLLDMAKDLRLTVYHGRRKYNHGVCAPYKKFIHIDADIKNTKYGCCILAHEIGHYLDFLERKFPEYQHAPKKEIRTKLDDGYYFDKQLPTSYVRKMEMSAINFSKRFMKKHGLSYNNVRDFNKEYFENDLLPWWMEWYNYTRVGKKCVKEVV